MSSYICMALDFGPDTSVWDWFRKEISSSRPTLWEFLIMKHHQVILPFAPNYFLMSVLVKSTANATAHWGHTFPFTVQPHLSHFYYNLNFCTMANDHSTVNAQWLCPYNLCEFDPLFFCLFSDSQHLWKSISLLKHLEYYHELQSFRTNENLLISADFLTVFSMENKSTRPKWVPAAV